jgi:hypothetical protein
MNKNPRFHDTIFLKETSPQVTGLGRNTSNPLPDVEGASTTAVVEKFVFRSIDEEEFKFESHSSTIIH